MRCLLYVSKSNREEPNTVTPHQSYSWKITRMHPLTPQMACGICQPAFRSLPARNFLTSIIPQPPLPCKYDTAPKKSARLGSYSVNGVQKNARFTHPKNGMDDSRSIRARRIYRFFARRERNKCAYFGKYSLQKLFPMV